NIYTGNSKLSCRFSPTAKLSFGYRRSWERRFEYDHEFKYIPQNAYQRTKNSYQAVTNWNHTLSGRTFYTLALSYFRTGYLLSPGGRTPNQINHYPNTSDDPIDIIIGYPGIDGRDEPHRDVKRYNGVYDPGEIFIDLNKNGYWNEGEPFIDVAKLNYHYDIGEVFRDFNGDAIWTGYEPYYDWGIDGRDSTFDEGEYNGIYDLGEPFTDYNGNGVREEPVGDQFYDYGFDQWAQWHKRYTEVLSIKGDITSQMTK
ncbi:unnamed protein product, partial [marine sediment metagenome]